MTDVRDTQIVRETAANPTDTPVRATSVVREVLTNPSDTPVRATSVVRETATIPTDTPLRATSIVREVLFRKPQVWPRWPDTVAPGSRIKASQISGLRDDIARHHLLAYGEDYGWTWPNVAAGDRILAKHLVEMRAAIQHLWDFKSRGSLPDWSSGVTPGGPSVETTATRILASDITDLRSWLELYENNHPPHAQGIDSKSYEPRLGEKPVITTAWAQDILSISTQKPLLVRCDVVAQADNTFSNEDIAKYQAAFNTYKSVLGAGNPGRVFAVFSGEFYRYDPDINEHRAPLGDDPNEPFYTNAYIRNFAERAATLAAWFRNPEYGGVEDYIIWNEPNNWPEGFQEPDLDAEHFAGLLYHCRNVMTRDVRLYWGGVFTNPTPGSNIPDVGNLRYTRDVYETLKGWGLCGGEFGSWPWNGVNLHIHRYRDEEFISNLLYGEDLYPELDPREYLHGIKTLQLKNGDSTELIVGEWGISVEDWGAGGSTPLSDVYGYLKDHVDVMFFHSHHAIKQGATTWGIHYYQSQQDQFVLTGFTDEDVDPPQYNADMEGLHGAYDALMGT